MRVKICEDWEVWLPTAEDVIIQKMRWCKEGKRQKDFDDVVDVLGVRKDRLDFKKIRRWCSIHGTLDLFNDALGEAGK